MVPCVRAAVTINSHLTLAWWAGAHVDHRDGRRHRGRVCLLSLPACCGRSLAAPPTVGLRQSSARATSCLGAILEEVSPPQPPYGARRATSRLKPKQQHDFVGWEPGPSAAAGASELAVPIGALAENAVDGALGAVGSAVNTGAALPTR